MCILQLRVQVNNDVLELKFPLGVTARVLLAAREGQYCTRRLIIALGT
jgi:hypothetical protein